MNIQQRAQHFITLGLKFKTFLNNKSDNSSDHRISDAIEGAKQHNPWFTEDNIRFSMKAIAEMTTEENLEKWLVPYKHRIESMQKEKSVGVIMAGNIPFAGFHDLLCVLLSGHKIIIKPSASDTDLIRLIANILINIDPEFKTKIFIQEDKLKGFDAIIATGSNNSSRYFEYYFGKYPHIIRKNRNSLAILTANETKQELLELGEDVFRYFGLGCRNVSAIKVPEDYDFELLIESFNTWNFLQDHNKYFNNYQYYKTISILSQEPYYDVDFYILKENKSLNSPLAVLHFCYYKDIKEINQFINDNEKDIQCIVSISPDINNTVKPGQSQFPQLWDYADDVDVMEFLLANS